MRCVRPGGLTANTPEPAYDSQVFSRPEGPALGLAVDIGVVSLLLRARGLAAPAEVMSPIRGW